MKNVNRELKQATNQQLEQVIEPLASYISAANRPKAALMSALAVLFRVVEETNHAANVHVTTLLEAQWCRLQDQTPNLRVTY
jgi:hypothetical protein